MHKLDTFVISSLFCYLQAFSKTERLTAVKDSVIDLGSLLQSYSLPHHGGNSIFIPGFKGDSYNKVVDDTRRKQLHLAKIR